MPSHCHREGAKGGCLPRRTRRTPRPRGGTLTLMPPRAQTSAPARNGGYLPARAAGRRELPPPRPQHALRPSRRPRCRRALSPRSRRNRRCSKPSNPKILKERDEGDGEKDDDEEADKEQEDKEAGEEGKEEQERRTAVPPPARMEMLRPALSTIPAPSQPCAAKSQPSGPRSKVGTAKSELSDHVEVPHLQAAALRLKPTPCTSRLRHCTPRFGTAKSEPEASRASSAPPGRGPKLPARSSAPPG